MSLMIDDREVESLTIALTDAEGNTSSQAISANVLVRALAGELGASMQEVSLSTGVCG